MLRRDAGDGSHFLTLTFWKSKAAIEAFAGPDIDAAKYYPEDESYLLEFEPTVTPYEVVTGADDGSLGELLADTRRITRGDDR